VSALLLGRHPGSGGPFPSPFPKGVLVIFAARLLPASVQRAPSQESASSAARGGNDHVSRLRLSSSSSGEVSVDMAPRPHHGVEAAGAAAGVSRSWTDWSGCSRSRPKRPSGKAARSDAQENHICAILPGSPLTTPQSVR
jgi:hypothetical protein